MRIIDKNYDYYDYLQDHTDTIVFDRRKSFMLTKEEFYRGIDSLHNDEYGIVLLQCGATFWLILVNILERCSNNIYESFNYPTKCSIELLRTWKNYNCENKLLELTSISSHSMLYIYDTEYVTRTYKHHYLNREKLNKYLDAIIDDINSTNYNVLHNFSHDTKDISYKNSFIREDLIYPILSSCGISDVIDSTELFCAIEEYFSIEKMKTETTEAKGATNDDKIIMHGFDTKTSFRGK